MPSPEFFGVPLRFAQYSDTRSATMFSAEGENLDLESSRSLQNSLPDKNYNTKRSQKFSNCLALLPLPLLQFMNFILIFMLTQQLITYYRHFVFVVYIAPLGKSGFRAILYLIHGHLREF